MSTWCMSLEWGPLESVVVLVSLKSNFEVDSTFHYRESTTLQYLMYITMR